MPPYVGSPSGALWTKRVLDLEGWCEPCLRARVLMPCGCSRREEALGIERIVTCWFSVITVKAANKGSTLAADCQGQSTALWPQAQGWPQVPGRIHPAQLKLSPSNSTPSPFPGPGSHLPLCFPALDDSRALVAGEPRGVCPCGKYEMLKVLKNQEALGMPCGAVR